ncbi:MAG: hypothetical protein ABEK50_06470 [bacterium]
MLDVLESYAPLLTKRKAIRKRLDSTGKNFGYEVLGDKDANARALKQWQQLVQTQVKKELPNQG